MYVFSIRLSLSSQVDIVVSIKTYYLNGYIYYLFIALLINSVYFFPFKN